MFILEERDILAAKNFYSVDPLKTVVSTVHPRDTMWHLAHQPIGYVNHGASALALVKTALNLSCRPTPSSILDFGCGHGRVGRWLRAEYPSSTIVGAEIIAEAVSFYSEAFSASGWQTETELQRNVPKQNFDLIWSGSVFTHLPAKSAMVLFSQFVDWLNPGGVAVFSVHGRISTNLFRNGTVAKTDRAVADSAIALFDKGEYGFAPYLDHEDYGMSFSPSGWWVAHVTASPTVRMAFYAEGGWAGNQDIVAVQKLPATYKHR